MEAVFDPPRLAHARGEEALDARDEFLVLLVHREHVKDGEDERVRVFDGCGHDDELERCLRCSVFVMVLQGGSSRE